MRWNRLEAWMTSALVPAAAVALFACIPPPEPGQKVVGAPAVTAPVAASSAAPAPGAATRISVPERVFNFGDSPRGKDVAHTFVIKNISDQVVHIKDAHGS